MFKTLFSSLFAVAMFAAGAIGSWYLSNMSPTEETEADATTTPVSVNTPVPPLSTASKGPKADLKKMPVAAYGKAISAEELFRRSADTKREREELARREEHLEKEANRVNLLHNDLEEKRKEVDALVEHNKEILASIEKLEVKVKQEMQTLQKLKDDRDQQLKKEAEAGKGDAANIEANVKTMSKFLAALEPDAAAATLKKLINDGKMDFVLQLLNNVPDRKAGEILNAIARTDDVLLARIMDEFQTLKRPAKIKR